MILVELSQWLKDLHLYFFKLEVALTNSSVVRYELEKITESYVPHCFISEQDGSFYILVYFLAGLYYICLT